MRSAGAAGRARWIALGVVLGSSLAAGSEPAAAPRPAPPDLVLIAAGTRVSGGSPRGWTNLVLKSVPCLASGDLDTLPSFAGTTASLFRSIILADVRPAPGRDGGYRLARVGLGLCVPDGEDDVIVTPEDPGESLGIVERKVLDRAAEELKKARLLARGEHFSVLASPSTLLVNGDQTPVHLFYALSVNPGDGRLTVAMWAATTGPERVRLSPVTRLAPNLVYKCGLDVKAERLLGALPVNWTFAMTALPPGDHFDTPDSLRPWLADARRIAAEPAKFEAAFRPLLSAGALKTPPPRHEVRPPRTAPGHASPAGKDRAG